MYLARLDAETFPMKHIARMVICTGSLFLACVCAGDPPPTDTPTPVPSDTATPVPESTATPSPTRTPTPIPNSFKLDRWTDCAVVVNPNVSDLLDLMADSAHQTYLNDTFGEVRLFSSNMQSYVAPRFADRAGFKFFCAGTSDTPGPGIDVEFSISVSSSHREDCYASGASGVCVEYASPTVSTDVPLTLQGTNYYRRGGLILRNLSDNPVTISASEVRAKLEIGSADRFFDLPGSVELEARRRPTCEVAVSGVLAATGTVSESCSGASGCSPSYVNDTANGELKFQAVVKDQSGQVLTPKSMQWVSSPSGIDAERGSWPEPPVQTVSTISALVEMPQGDRISCSVKVRPRGSADAVSLLSGGDCQLFQALRWYYLCGADASSTAGGVPDVTRCPAQTTPYGPIGFPEFSAVSYGTIYPEVPFSGVMNAWAAMDGYLGIGVGGVITPLALAERFFERTVIVAYPYNRQGGTIGDPIYWGTLDRNDYSTTLMSPISGGSQISDDTDVTFSLFNVAPQRVAGNPSASIRGTTGGIPYWTFTAGDSAAKAFDKIVPFLDDSCPSVFLLPMPKRSDKPELPQAMRSASLCGYSIPYTVGQLRTGRVRLKALHMAPQDPAQLYPVDLLRTSRRPPCTATPAEAADQVACWKINPKDLPPKTSRAQYSQRHRSCFEYVLVGGVPVRYTYEASCPVLVGDECNKSLEYRLASSEMYTYGALGCAVKNDWSGIAISPLFTGVLYSTPVAGHDYGGSLSTGYGCVKCRNQYHASAAGVALGGDNGSQIFSFVKSTGARKCVRQTKFAMRRWGSSGCDDHHYSLEYTCWGSVSTCPASSVDYGAGKGVFSSSGNVFGQYTAPLCQGSHMDFDSISVSYSPLVVDVRGAGIQISRVLEDAVNFDIRGKGTPNLVDWPVNTNDVAFLLRPGAGKPGKASIRQLFGDDRARNGFVALRVLDSNRDGSIDRRDRDFRKLSLWFDRNRNGSIDDGEVESLARRHVDVIYLKYSKLHAKGDERDTLGGVYFNAAQGKFFNVEDVYFNEYWKGGRRITAR